MSPRARLNTLLGYSAPFDRHDWVVDRCGKTIEYVIDFYAGRQDQTGGAPGQSSYPLHRSISTRGRESRCAWREAWAWCEMLRWRG